MKRKPFTLLELSAAMVVLVIFMLFIMRFYDTSQDVMNRSAGKISQYEQARVIMDLLANDLQNIYYSEGYDEPVYFQEDYSSGNTKNLSFFVLRQQSPGGSTKTDLAMVTYHYDSNNYTLKMGVAGDDQDSKWNSHLTGSNLGLLADGVASFRVIPVKVGAGSSSDSNISLSDLVSSAAGKPRIPDYVKIELRLMDGETAAAIAAYKEKGLDLPKALDPTKGDDFKGKDKIRSFYRIVEIDRGQY